MFEEQGWVMRWRSIVDATIIAAPSPVKNADGARDPQMRQALKGNPWCVGMKAHIGVEACAGYRGASKRPDIADAPNLAQVEYPLLIAKPDFGFDKTRYRGSPRTSTTSTCCSPRPITPARKPRPLQTPR